MEGWIKLHRRIKDHWIWKSQNRFQWWIDILLSVNHSDTKVLIKGTLIECKRGQCIKSLETWGKEWNVTKGAVRDFFKLLERDQMIHTESLQITTRITVSNYEDYQTELYTEKTHRKRKTNGEETQGLPKQEGEEGFKNENNEKEKILFDNFRKEFPGTKRGNDTEFENFTKKNKDWKAILPLLLPRLNYQKEARAVRRDNKLFVPEWKNLATWLNNKCWEDKINTQE